MYSELQGFNGEITRAEAMFKSMRRTTDDLFDTCIRVLSRATPRVYLEHDSQSGVDRPLGDGTDVVALRQALGDFDDRAGEKVLKPLAEWKLGFRTASNSVRLLGERSDAVVERHRKLDGGCRRRGAGAFTPGPRPQTTDPRHPAPDPR